MGLILIILLSIFFVLTFLFPDSLYRRYVPNYMNPLIHLITIVLCDKIHSNRPVSKYHDFSTGAAILDLNKLY